jgi:hypothetical protein
MLGHVRTNTLLLIHMDPSLDPGEMPRRKKASRLSYDLKCTIIRLTVLFPTNVVSLLADVSEDTIRRLVDLFSLTGDIEPLESGKKRGRRPIFNEDEMKVRSTLAYILSFNTDSAVLGRLYWSQERSLSR